MNSFECKCWMLVCMAESCMVNSGLYFETHRAKRYRRFSDTFCFTIFVHSLCRTIITGADWYTYFCCCGLY